MTLLYKTMAFSAFVFLFATIVFAFPAPVGYVNDFAGVISQDEAARLERQLSNFEQTNKDEIAVVTVDSLDGDSIEDYANKLFRAWGIGKRGADNGVLLLVAPSNHKVRIEVGRRLEPYLTDAKAAAIIQTMTPWFKMGDFSKGVDEGVNGIIDTLSSVSVDEQRGLMEHETKSSGNGLIIGIIVILCLVGLAFFFYSLIGHDEEDNDSEFMDDDFVVRNSKRRLRSAIPPVVAIPAATAAASHKSKSSNDDDDTPSRSSWSSDDDSHSSWSSGDSGGFGGFGGGDSGGGGASGSW